MTQRYRAFITYSHTNEATAKWLHTGLEKFVVPKQLRTASNPDKTLTPIFRDRDELTAAGELTDTLKSAMEVSDALIVICSPASAKSRWVNKEIDWFRLTHPGASIACVIVSGEPGDPDNECFPTALDDPSGQRAQDRVSADLRDGRDNRHDALLRVAAVLLEVGFDTLKQRHQHRRIRALMVLNALGSMIIVALGVLAWIAYQASQDAVRRQGQAEGLVSFMLGDLRSHLEPIGRLDLLDAVGDEASNYFASLEDVDETDDVLLSRAKAMRQIGDIRMRQGRLADAVLTFDQALQQNKLLSARAPRNAGRLYELAQAEFWVGYAHRRNADLQAALEHMQRYLEHARNLQRLDPDNADYALEVGYANNNLGTLNIDKGNLADAERHFAAAEATMRASLDNEPENTQLKGQLAQVFAWQGKTALALGQIPDSISYHNKQEDLLRLLVNEQPNDKPKQRHVAVALLLHGEGLALIGKTQLAREKFSEAHEIMKALTAHDANNHDWQRNAARALWYLGRTIEQSGDLDSAIQNYEKVLEAFIILVQQDAQQARWLRDLSETAATLIRAHRNNGSPDRALALAEMVDNMDAVSSTRLNCELVLARHKLATCHGEVVLAEKALELQPDTASYITLYSVLHAQNDPRQEDAWDNLLNRSIRDRDFINTL